MEINIKDNEDVFGNLSVGDTFLDKAGYTGSDGEVFMVIEKDYGLEVNPNHDGYAICLNTGRIYGFDDEEEVIRVEVSATVTR